MSSLHRLPSNSALKLNGRILNGNELVDELSAIGVAFGKSFESLHVWSDGQVVIGSSNLFGPQLNGFVTKYAAISDVPSEPSVSLAPDFGGCANVTATRDRNLICAFDSGHVLLLNSELEELNHAVCHDSHICRLSMNESETKIVSCGYDCRIFVLDLTEFVANKVYDYAHSSSVWDVQFSPFDDNLLLSVGRDGKVLLWDLRLSKPASQMLSCSAETTAVCWSSKDTSLAYVGDSYGRVMTIDVRHPGTEIIVRDVAHTRVHRIKSVSSGEQIAICADENSFYVYDSELLDVVYTDNSLHSDWVRDYCEHEGSLYTIGRDTQLVRHNLNTSL